MTEREFAIEVVRRLRDAGHQALWAGGCVRDEQLGLSPKDYDIATDAPPDIVRRLFRRTVAVGVSFGVVKVLGPPGAEPPLEVEVVTFRSDRGYSDGRHPDAVVFGTPREDALRRDFTINGMFFDPLDGRLIDYVGGLDDLRAHVLRAIGDPEERFREDKLRLLRAVRIAACFELEIEPATRAAIQRLAGEIRGAVSDERVANELRVLLVNPHRAQGARLLEETGLAEAILPEIREMQGVPQGPPHAPTGDLWDHTLRVLELLGGTPSFPLAFAALLHDVGKRRTLGRAADRLTFYNHEHVGRRMAADIARRLRLSNAERERIEWLVEKHQVLCDAPRMRTSRLKPILAHPGVRELLALHRADSVASGRSTAHVEYCERLLDEWSEADLNPPPFVGGHDLMREGLTPGPRFKQILDAVREAQLDGAVKNRGQAMEMLRRLLRERPADDPAGP